MEVWTSYAGSASSNLLDQVEKALPERLKQQKLPEQQIQLRRYLRRSEVGDANSDDEQTLGRDAQGEEEAPFNDDISAVAFYTENLPAAHSKNRYSRVTDEYYLKPGEAIDYLIQRIAGATHCVVFLSEAYFKSPYCLSELAFSMAQHQGDLLPVVVDQYKPGGLSEILSGEKKVTCKLPGGQPESSISLCDALCQIVQSERKLEGLQQEKRQQQICSALKQLSKLLTAPGDADVIGDAIISHAKNSVFDEARYNAEKVLLHWCDVDTMAFEFCEYYDLRGRATSIVTSKETSISLRQLASFDNTGAASQSDTSETPLKSALASFNRTQNPKPLEFRRFLETLCGFLALPLVNSQVKHKITAKPGGPFFIDARRNSGEDDSEQQLLLEGALARASLYGGGLMLQAAGRDSREWPVPRGVSQIGVKPIDPQSKGTLTVEGLTCHVWCTVWQQPESQFPHWDPETGLSLQERRSLRAELKEMISSGGEACVALAAVVSRFHSQDNWHVLAHDFMVKLNNNGPDVPADNFKMDVLIVRRTSDALEILPFDADDKVSRRFTMIRGILALAK